MKHEKCSSIIYLSHSYPFHLTLDISQYWTPDSLSARCTYCVQFTFHGLVCSVCFPWICVDFISCIAVEDSVLILLLCYSFNKLEASCPSSVQIYFSRSTISNFIQPTSQLWERDPCVDESPIQNRTWQVVFHLFLQWE